MDRKRKSNYICLCFVLCIAIIMAMAPDGVAAAANDLSAAYKLEYSVVDGNLNDKFQVMADDTGRVKLVAPFISGGCIAINNLKIQSVELKDNGIKTINLQWNCDQGSPCEAYIPVQLRAGLQLPEPGKYLIKLWAHETVDSAKIVLVGQQECVWTTDSVPIRHVVDGLLGATWQMGAEKLSKVMTAQGFRDETVIDQGNVLRYRGAFGGYPCYLSFSLWDNKFYMGTVSALAQTREVAHNAEVQTCFTRLADIMIAQYGQPTRQSVWKGARSYYWEELPGTLTQDKIDVLLLEDFAEGGLTEGSVQVRVINRPLENCLYYQLMGRTPAGSCDWVH